MMMNLVILLIYLLMLGLSQGVFVNVARDKPCVMSYNEGRYGAGAGVDGDNTTSILSGSTKVYLPAWWKVDLQKEVHGPLVLLRFSKGNRARRYGVRIFTSQTPFSSYPGKGKLCHAARGQTDGRDIPDFVGVNCTGTWRYLLVYTQMRTYPAPVLLDFVELEVLECSPGTYGANCTQDCSSRYCVTSSECDRNGTCIMGCKAGWEGNDCRRGEIINLALNKPSDMSSVYISRDSWGSQRAVDGDLSTHVKLAMGGQFAWWTVDLQGLVTNPLVKIHFRTYDTIRRNGIELFTSPTAFQPSYDKYTPPQDRLCLKVTGKPDGTNIPDVVSVNCSGTWRHLMVYTDTMNYPSQFLFDFAEIQVLVCRNGFYGSDCNLFCDRRNCLNSSSSCSHVTGACLGGCQKGWDGFDCTQSCPEGSFGSNCERSCADRNCVSTSSCDHVTGSCDSGCKGGWSGDDCTKVCRNGFYGSDCNLFCDRRNCLNASSPCNHVTGTCVGGCQKGWGGFDCTQSCPEGSFGSNCERSCADRNCVSTSSCDHVTGSCDSGCKGGWSGDDCTKGWRMVQNCTDLNLGSYIKWLSSN